MISPHTPPGTPLVVVWIPMTEEENLKLIKAQYRSMAQADLTKPCELSVGQRVVLDQIVFCPILVRDFGAMLTTTEGLWSLECFDIASLPSTITDLLQPVKEDA